MEEEEARKGYSICKGPEVGQVCSLRVRRRKGKATVMRQEHEQMSRWVVRS